MVDLTFDNEKGKKTVNYTSYQSHSYANKWQIIQDAGIISRIEVYFNLM